MKGDTVVINGDRWTVVDVAPAAPLAEMVAAILEEEGFVAITRGSDSGGDVFTHLGTDAIGTSYVLVPERDAEQALALIEETVTDYQGEELELLMKELEAQGLTLEDLARLEAEEEDDGDEGEALS